MAKSAPKLKRGEAGWARPALYALAVFLVLAFVKLLPFWQGISGKAFDALSTFHPPRPGAPGVIIVAIDEPSFTEINQQWPWPRFYHADLLKALYGAGAKAVAFDVVFADQSHPQDDRDLGAAASPGTVFAADLSLIESDHASTLVRTDPLPVLLSGGAVSGIAGVETDRDGAVRKMPDFDDGFMRVLAKTAGSAPASLEGKNRLIQYFGPSGSYPRASYYQALKPDEFLPPGFFKDAVVLVGYSLQTTPDPEAGAADTFETPYTLSTGKFMAGVEVQANIYDNFKHGLFIKNAPSWIGFILLALGALLGLLVSRLHKPSMKWIGGGAALAGLVLAAWLAVRFGRVWLSPWDAGAGLLAVMGTLAARDFAIERKLRGEIQGAFSQYLAPAMVEKIIDDPSQLNLGGESKTLTILFADIRGFTGLSETFKTDPQGLTQLINDILTPLADIVMKHGGTIDKFIGDCIMAFWNAPLDDEDHAQNGVNAAREMVGALGGINAQIAKKIGRDDLAVRIGIGLNSGDCVVGNMGSQTRFDYSVLGDPVNVAARLEGLSKTYKRNIVFGENTYNLLSDKTGCEEIDEVQVRGREEKLKVYAVD